MSNHRPPSSRPPERNRDDERHAYDYYSDKEYRSGGTSRSARNTSSRTSSSRASARDEPMRSSSSRSSYRSDPPRAGSARSSSRNEPPRARAPYRDEPMRSGSRPPNTRSGRPPSGGQQGRRPPQKRRPSRRRFPILPIVVVLAILAIIIVLVVRGIGGKKDSNAEYGLVFSSPVMVVGSTAQASVSGLPENSDAKISWSTNDSEAVSVKNGMLTAKKVKDAVTISATVNGKTVTGTVKVIEKVEGVLSLTLDPAEISILSGKTQQIKFTINFEAGVEQPAVQPIWTSSNVAVATVSSDGLVTARDVGSASITATLGNQSAVCSITVAPDPNASPPETDPNASGGDNMQPDAGDASTAGTTSPGSNANTGNPGGTTTPVGTSANTAGTNAATNAGNNTSNKQTPTVDSISISQALAYLEVGQTMVLGASVSPSSIPLSWTSSNPAIATVGADGTVTGVGAGTVTITATAGGHSVSCSLQVDASTEPPAGGQ